MRVLLDTRGMVIAARTNTRHAEMESSLMEGIGNLSFAAVWAPASTVIFTKASIPGDLRQIFFCRKCSGHALHIAFAASFSTLPFELLYTRGLNATWRAATGLQGEKLAKFVLEKGLWLRERHFWKHWRCQCLKVFAYGYCLARVWHIFFDELMN